MLENGLFVANPEPESEWAEGNSSASLPVLEKQGGEGTLVESRAFFRVTALLLGVVLAAFAPLLKAGFINYDDPQFVSKNLQLADGLSWSALRWGVEANLSYFHPGAEYWEPLVILSRLLDVSLYGMQPEGHHLTSLLLHALNSVLLCRLLWLLELDRFRSVLVALLFALHPLNVEVVGWLSARKDLIGATLTLVVMMVYCHYVRRPQPWRYVAVIAVYGVAAMTKPMVMVVPALLLLLDDWPLKRLEPLRARLIEKGPLFVIALGVAVLAWRAQAQFNAIQGMDISPIPRRLLNVVVNYSIYLRQIIWPRALSIFYPNETGLSFGSAVGPGLVLACVSGLVLRCRNRFPQMFMGWLWFLLALSPVIGWVGLGSSRTADRYMYLPGIGLWMGAVFLPWETWMPKWLLDKCRYQSSRFACQAILGLSVATLSVATFQQAQVWANSVTVFSNARRFYPRAPTINLQLALAFLDEGNHSKAVSLSLEVIRAKTQDAKAWRILGTALGRLGHAGEAKRALQKAILFDPKLTVAYLDLSVLEADSGNMEGALAALERATGTTPNYAETYYRRALIYIKQERLEDALRDLDFLLALRPKTPEYALLLAQTANAAGKKARAREVLRKHAESFAGSPELLGDVELLQRQLAQPAP